MDVLEFYENLAIVFCSEACCSSWIGLKKWLIYGIRFLYRIRDLAESRRQTKSATTGAFLLLLSTRTRTYGGDIKKRCACYHHMNDYPGPHISDKKQGVGDLASPPFVQPAALSVLSRVAAFESLS